MTDRATVEEFVATELNEMGVCTPDSIRPEQKLSDLGMDDLDIMDLIIDAEDTFFITVSEAEEKQLQSPEATVRDAVDMFFKLLK